MDESGAGFSARRRMVLLSAAAVLVRVSMRPAVAAPDAPHPANEYAFPQMPTGGTGVTPCGSYAPPPVIPSVGRIAPPEEPGERLEISGTVYGYDRNTPASDIVLFLYHTDAQGHYNNPNSPFNPRLHGWVKSDRQGHYGFQTIKPAPYPELSTPAHIHVTLFGMDVPEYWADEYWFAGDPLITPRQRALLTGRGGGGETVTLKRDRDGVLHGTRDFILEHVAVAGGCTLRRP
jgi:protocatechuate 3,4-dioxygenase, beta subunit